jgi:hypothetical protein
MIEYNPTAAMAAKTATVEVEVTFNCPIVGVFTDTFNVQVTNPVTGIRVDGAPIGIEWGIEFDEINLGAATVTEILKSGATGSSTPLLPEMTDYEAEETTTGVTTTRTVNVD